MINEKPGSQRNKTMKLMGEVEEDEEGEVYRRKRATHHHKRKVR